MSECDLMRESMPLLLTESLDPARRVRSSANTPTPAAVIRWAMAATEGSKNSSRPCR